MFHRCTQPNLANSAVEERGFVFGVESNGLVQVLARLLELSILEVEIGRVEVCQRISRVHPDRTLVATHGQRKVTQELNTQ